MNAGFSYFNDSDLHKRYASILIEVRIPNSDLSPWDMYFGKTETKKVCFTWGKSGTILPRTAETRYRIYC
jgi:hypothetical protein